MNVVCMTGRLTRDPFYREKTEDKSSLAGFTIAVESYKGKDSEGKTIKEANFFNCLTFSYNADYLHKYAKKGTKVEVQGSLANKQSEGEDGTVYHNDVVICKFVSILGYPKGKDNKEEGDEAEEDAGYADGFYDVGDDLPFN